MAVNKIIACSDIHVPSLKGIDELKEIFDEINYNYITSNSDKLESLELEIISKYKVLLNNTINNVKLFNDNLENSRVGIAKSRAILDGIESVDL